MPNQFKLGTPVIRVNDAWLPDQRGEIVDTDETRVRIMWKNKNGSNDKRTWQAKSAQGLRWAVLTQEGC